MLFVQSIIRGIIILLIYYIKNQNLGEVKMKKLITIVVPCYNEEESLPYFYEEITKVSSKMEKNNFEFLFVNDGSTDNTLSLIKKMKEKDNRIRYISFSRNFGKEAAMYAGLEYSKGDYIAIMDADLQDPPSMLPKMYDLIENEKYDCVGTRRLNRKGEPPIRSFFAKLFYKIINKFSKVEIVDGARDYRLITRQMADAVVSLKEYNRYSKGLFSFVGFNTKWLEYENVKRVAGETKWSFWMLFKYAIEAIVEFTITPLYISIILGIIMCLTSFIATFVFLLKYIAFEGVVQGWIIMTLIIILISGIQLLCIGVVGQYLAKTYLETKKRPIYIVKETEKNK